MGAFVGPLVCIFDAHLFSFSQLYLILLFLLTIKLVFCNSLDHAFIWLQM